MLDLSHELTRIFTNWFVPLKIYPVCSPSNNSWAFVPIRGLLFRRNYSSWSDSTVFWVGSGSKPVSA
jgi:hypothetical protein